MPRKPLASVKIARQVTAGKQMGVTVSVIDRISRNITRAVHDRVEGVFRKLDQSQMSRGPALSLIPPPEDRGGGLGTTTYAEWCYIIGVFQTMIFQNLPRRPLRMLDVGCGAGRMYLSVRPYLTAEDSYLGIDVNAEFVARCKRLYPADNVEFLHTAASNAYYAAGVDGGPRRWPMADGAHNLITALSVWTHLREEDWRFYLHEVSRVLAPGGRAIISFFITDELYKPDQKSDRTSKFYRQPENKWIFDASAYGSKHWTYPSWAEVPEVAIAVDIDTFNKEVADAGLNIVQYLPGSWKDQPGYYFQDVVVFEKP
jgi:SAM-dependent methyltransferase